jgi:arylsulfatase
MLGNRGIYKDGWWAGSRNLLPWQMPAFWEHRDLEQHPWELYNLNEDFSQAHDLAAQYPEKLKELQELFDSEARRNNVYPFLPYSAPQPAPNGGGFSFTYRTGVERIPAASAPQLIGRPFRITADVEIPESGAEGVILAQGSRNGGYTLFVKDGKVAYEVNAFGNVAGAIVSPTVLPPGKSQIVVDFKPEKTLGRDKIVLWSMGGPAVASLSINGKPAGETRIANFGGYYRETLDIGKDLGTAVSASYASPFVFTGHIQTVRVDVQ